MTSFFPAHLWVLEHNQALKVLAPRRCPDRFPVRIFLDQSGFTLFCILINKMLWLADFLPPCPLLLLPCPPPLFLLSPPPWSQYPSTWQPGLWTGSQSETNKVFTFVTNNQNSDLSVSVRSFHISNISNSQNLYLGVREFLL